MRRKNQGIRRSVNKFGLDTFDHQTPMLGTSRARRLAEDEKIRQEVAAAIAAQGGIREPGTRRKRTKKGGDTSEVDSTTR